jgi:FtsH-binding integral membrane protein
MKILKALLCTLITLAWFAICLWLTDRITEYNPRLTFTCLVAALVISLFMFWYNYLNNQRD